MKRILKLAVASAAFIVPFAARAADVPPTLDKIKASGTIVLGVREASYPLSYLDRDGKAIGYHIDICNRIVDAVRAKLDQPSLKVVQTTVTSQTRIPRMEDGTIDLECGSTTNTEMRQQRVAFAPTTYLATVRLAVKKRSGIEGIPDLGGRAVVTTEGSTALDLLRSHYAARTLDIKAVYAKDHAESFRLLETDNVAAFVMDDNLLAGLILTSRNPDAYTITGRSLDLQPIAIMLRRNDPAFKELVDRTVGALIESGEARRLYIKWFQSPIPPSQVNLNFPITALLDSLLTYPDSAPAEAYRPPE